MATNIFVNHEEGRLRAAWRIILQMLLFIAITVVGQMIMGIGIAIFAMANGAMANDPAFLNTLESNPLVRVASAILSMISILISYLVAVRWLDRRPFRDFGFHINKNWWMDFGFGLFLGAILMVFIFVVEQAAGWITITGTMSSQRPGVDFWSGIASWVVVYICVGFYEEMLSRGYQLRNLAEGLNLPRLNPKLALLLAYLISSSIFGMLHASNPNATLISTLNLIVAGLFLGFGYVLTGELAIPIGLHITWNFFQGNVFGFPVSGMGTPATFIAIQQGGPELWTGGAFGPEAGLIGLVAIAIGFGLIALWVKLRYGQVKLCETLAVYEPTKKNLVNGAETGQKPAITPAD